MAGVLAGRSPWRQNILAMAQSVVWVGGLGMGRPALKSQACRRSETVSNRTTRSGDRRRTVENTLARTNRNQVGGLETDAEQWKDETPRLELLRGLRTYLAVPVLPNVAV